jgi:DinB family protein
MTIVPDTKNWTWVLERPCPECGMDTSSIAFAELPGLIRANAAAWREVLAGPGERAARPRPDRWSALEYACHVRDVFRLYDHRLTLMLTEDDPLFPDWDQDKTAVADRYGEQDPATVASGLAAAADAIADRFAGVDAGQRRRRGRRSDGAEFTIETFGRYFIHDPVHHLWDVTGVGASRQRG